MLSLLSFFACAFDYDAKNGFQDMYLHLYFYSAFKEFVNYILRRNRKFGNITSYQIYKYLFNNFFFFFKVLNIISECKITLINGLMYSLFFTFYAF